MTLVLQPGSATWLQVMDEIVGRTAKAMVAEGMPYRGVIFAGLMIKNGKVGIAACCSDYSRHQGQDMLSCCSIHSCCGMCHDEQHCVHDKHLLISAMAWS